MVKKILDNFPGEDPPPWEVFRTPQIPRNTALTPNEILDTPLGTEFSVFIGNWLREFGIATHNSTCRWKLFIMTQSITWSAPYHNGHLMKSSIFQWKFANNNGSSVFKMFTRARACKHCSPWVERRSRRSAVLSTGTQSACHPSTYSQHHLTTTHL